MISGNNIFFPAGVAFIARVILPCLLVFQHRTTEFNEIYSPDFVTLAHNIAMGSFRLTLEPELYYMPGYSLFLAMIGIINQSPLFIVVVQVLLSVATVLLIYGCVVLLGFSARCAAKASLCYALEPLSILFTALVMPETLFTFLVVLCFYLLLKATNASSVNLLVSSALALGAAVMVSPIAYGLLFFLPLGLLISRKETKLSLARAILFFIVAVIMVGSWQVRNYIVSGRFLLTSGVSIKIADQARVLVFDNESAIEDAFDSRNKPFSLHSTGQNLKIIFSHPLQSAKNGIHGLLSVYSGLEVHTYARMLGITPFWKDGNDEQASGLMAYVFNNPRNVPFSIYGLLVFTGALTMSIYVLAALGLLRLNGKWGLIWALLIIGYLSIVSSGIWGYSRFRHPIMPFLCIFAGIGIDFFLSKFQKAEKLFFNRPNSINGQQVHEIDRT